MEHPPEPLNSTEQRRLGQIVEREADHLVPLARDAGNARWLSDDECEQLSSVLLRVFLNHLGPDDEPDREGAEADDLIARIEMQRQGFWVS